MSNHITVTGKVGKDPELKFTPSGMAVLTFSVADNYGKDDKKKTTWHNITVFGQLAEHTANSITQGTTVIIDGRFEQDEYTKKDGTKGKATKIIANELGVSCRWNAWVQDQTDKVMAQVGELFPGVKAVAPDEEFF